VPEKHLRNFISGNIFLSLKNFLSLNSESYQGRAKKHKTS